MNLRFTKMHGLGNDFVLIDAMDSPVELGAERVRQLADRHLGVGCDQVLLLEPPAEAGVVCRYRVFNADGSEAEQCGNGMRCIGLYLHDKGVVGGDPFRVQGRAGDLTIAAEGPDGVTVNMGRPELEPARIPFLADRIRDRYAIRAGEEELQAAVLSMGNPHAVMTVDDAAHADVQRLGPLIEHHESFPERTNVAFMQVQSRNDIRLRVHERGTGETRACGSGACAAVVAGRLLGLLDERVSVTLPGGTLVIEWNGKDGPVWMTGPATRVFEGTIDL